MPRRPSTSLRTDRLTDRRHRLGSGTCRQCGTQYSREREWQIFCSDRCRAEFHRTTSLCFYCGDTATSRDHIIPVREIGKRIYVNIETVPSCTECNNTLGGTSDEDFSLRMKRRIVAHAKKYNLRQGLEPPAWANSEIEDLGPGLRDYIRTEVRRRHRAEARLVYMLEVLFAWNKGQWTTEDKV